MRSVLQYAVSWLRILNVLPESFLVDVVLGDAYNRVTTARYHSGETADEFGT